MTSLPDRGLTRREVEMPGGQPFVFEAETGLCLVYGVRLGSECHLVAYDGDDWDTIETIERPEHYPGMPLEFVEAVDHWVEDTDLEVSR